MCAALRRESDFEIHVSSILVAVGNCKLGDYNLQKSLERNARPALPTSLGCDREELLIRRRDGGGGAGASASCLQPVVAGSSSFILQAVEWLEGRGGGG